MTTMLVQCRLHQQFEDSAVEVLSWKPPSQGKDHDATILSWNLPKSMTEALLKLDAEQKKLLMNIQSLEELNEWNDSLERIVRVHKLEEIQPIVRKMKEVETAEEEEEVTSDVDGESYTNFPMCFLYG